MPGYVCRHEGCDNEYSTKRGRGTHENQYHDKPTTKCETCGKTIETSFRELEQYDKQFCSDKCDSQYRSDNPMTQNLPDNNKGSDHPRYVERHTVECDNCNSDIERVPSDISSGNNFCDSDCYHEFLRDNMQGENNPNWKGGTVSVECTQCSEELEVERRTYNDYRKNGKNFYCSDDCRVESFRDSMSGEEHPRYTGYQRYYGTSWRTKKKQARQRDNHKCQECGATRDEMGQEPDVHHITPFREFDDSQEANKLDNLVCLCKRCHAKTDNNRKNTLQ